MSSEYDAVYGIGYQVIITDKEHEKLDTDLKRWLLGEQKIGITVITTGDYRPDIETCTFLVIADPFKGGLDLSEKKKVLDNEIKRLELTVLSEFGLFGGVCIS